MKSLTLLLILLLSVSPVLSKNSKELEDIINTILSEQSPAEKGISSPDQDNPPSENAAVSENIIVKKGTRAASAASPGKVLLETAIQLYDASLYDKARESFTVVKNEYGGEFGEIASVWLARILMKMNKLNEAAAELTTIKADSGEYPMALYYRGEIETQRGDLENAIVSYNGVSSRFPGHELADDALLSLARIYLDLNKGKQALEAAIRIIKTYKGRETEDDAFCLLGKIFEKDSTLRDFGVARKIYRKFLKLASDTSLPNFANSPLKEGVKRNLQTIESTYFRFEN